MQAGRLLVVDDEESTRSLMNEFFTGLGYTVVTANDGEDALRKFAPGAFDCIISDLRMPTIDGLALLKKISIEDKDVFFLIITGFPGIDSAVDAMKEGAYDYITKPLHMEDIRMKVERALKAKRTQESLKKIKGLFLSMIILMPVLVTLGIIFGILWKGV